MRDRRSRRSHTALLNAAVALVTERGTTSISVLELAESADVSRQLVYQKFADKDALLLEAALDLARKELVPQLLGGPETVAAPGRRSQVLALATHFAKYRSFYRAMLTGSCAYAFKVAIFELLTPISWLRNSEKFGKQLDPCLVKDLSTYMTGGANAMINEWVIDGGDPLDPEHFTDRLMRILPMMLDNRPETSPTTIPPAEGGVR